MLPQEFGGRPVGDLRVVAGEAFMDEDGSRWVVVYDAELDALGFVGEAEERDLVAAGAVVIQTASP